jgi:hypothetical protein
MSLKTVPYRLAPAKRTDNFWIHNPFGNIGCHAWVNFAFYYFSEKCHYYNYIRTAFLNNNEKNKIKKPRDEKSENKHTKK